MFKRSVFFLSINSCGYCYFFVSESVLGYLGEEIHRAPGYVLHLQVWYIIYLCAEIFAWHFEEGCNVLFLNFYVLQMFR